MKIHQFSCEMYFNVIIKKKKEQGELPTISRRRVDHMGFVYYSMTVKYLE